MEISKMNMKNFRADFAQAVRQLEESYQCKIALGGITYVPSVSFTVKMTVTNAEDGAEEIAFNKYCALYGFLPEHYQFEFLHGGKTFRFIGFKTSARKNVCKIREVGTEKEYLTSLATLKHKITYS